MPIKTRFLAFYSITIAAFVACAPDLDALVTEYAGGAGGAGGTSGTGGTDASGGMDAGTGGTEPGTGGTEPGTGGSSMAGESGEGGESGSSAGKGGSSGKGGSDGTGGSTVMPSACMNESTDSNESDLDCGGSSDCKRCGLTQSCTRNSDCASAYCRNRRCAQPTCADDAKNQDETAVDCGGSCAPDLACEDGQGCREDQDCAGEFCSGEVCTDHCTSERREATETDEDCGGPDCAPCAATKRCNEAEDCESKVCFNNLCQAASCADGVRNQDESDQDCGGVCTSEGKWCLEEDRCNSAADCESYVCTDGRCADDLVIGANAVIDNLEDSNNVIPLIDGRTGNWYQYSDQTATPTLTIAAIPGKRGPNSLVAVHTTGSGFMTWGSGIGVDLNSSSGTKQPWDASAYRGVTFWGRAEATVSVTNTYPDGNTDPSGGVCNALPAPDGVCDHHWNVGISLTPTWKRYTVLFADLVLEPGTVPPPTAPDPSRLVSIQFRVQPGTTYDFWIDDLAFLE
jgi:hypothetical protein